VVPLALVLVAGTLYHWMDGLHHFTEHMRHRRRVHELEAEITSLRAHLDHVLEMPDHSTSRLPSKAITAEPLPPVHETEAAALPEPVADAEAVGENGSKTAHQRSARGTKRAAEPDPAPVATEGAQETAATESAAGA
jgi:uncharacterized membrane protein